ncbi:MAG TPA: hypothetical protein GX513_00380 [Firmicutes bacterium]|nr:hypothetical protein [Bacillota bacterium]
MRGEDRPWEELSRRRGLAGLLLPGLPRRSSPPGLREEDLRGRPMTPTKEGEGAREGEEGAGERPPVKLDWRDIVAFTIAMYQILAVPFLLFCGVALLIYFLLWLWAH